MANKSVVAATNEKVSIYIPDEVSFSILSKLPLKSLKRFECVQKSWSLLFQNHHFINMFRNKFLSYNDPSSLILRAVENDYEVFYYFSGEKYEKTVKLDWLNSSEEDHECILMFVLVVLMAHFVCMNLRMRGKIVLWNPPTRTINFLPPRQI
jgi:molecular chaperone HtpG